MEKSNKRHPIQADRSADFSNHARRGLQYLPKEEDLAASVARIDAAVAAKTKAQQLKQSAKIRFITKIAAVLILAAGSVTYLLLPNNKQQYTQWNLPDNNLAARAGTTADLPAIKYLADGTSAYQAKDYKAAAAHFSSYLHLHPSDSEVHFYYALSLLGSRQYPSAVQAFSDLLAAQPPSSIADNARWFLAMTYLESHEPQKAKPILEALSQNSDNYQYEAAQALSRLHKM